MNVCKLVKEVGKDFDLENKVVINIFYKDDRDFGAIAIGGKADLIPYYPSKVKSVEFNKMSVTGIYYLNIYI